MADQLISTTAWVAPPDVADLAPSAAGGDYDLLVVPFRIDDEGRGVYRDTEQLMVKELRAAGINAGYIHDPEVRRFQSEHAETVVAALTLWVISSLGWDAVKVLGQYILQWGSRVTGARPDASIRVRIARLERADGALVEGVEIEGPSTEAASEVVRQIGILLDVAEDARE